MLKLGYQKVKKGQSHTSVPRLYPRGVDRVNLTVTYRPSMIKIYPEYGGNIINVLLDETSCRVM
jgi:hypothetical protein